MRVEQDLPIVIRLAGPADEPRLARLATLDSAEALEGPALIAEVGDEPWAVVELETGRAVADPFRPSAELVALLRVHAEHRREPAPRAALRRRRRDRRRAWAQSGAAAC
jgi:hypothetical protein